MARRAVHITSDRVCAGPPSRPDGPIRVIRVTRNMLAIHWSPPYDCGGYPIERYVVEKRDATHSFWTQVGSCPPDVTAFCVTDLAENQTYYFRVVAETAYGSSEPLELDKPVVPRRIFGENSFCRYVTIYYSYIVVHRLTNDRSTMVCR